MIDVEEFVGKRRSQPIGHVVAGIAIGGIQESDMIGNTWEPRRIRTLKFRIVAADASGGQCAAVIAVHVAQGASRRRVRPNQRKRCGRMIECGRCPIRRRVADRAILREACGHVIRDCAAERRGAGPRRQVAGDARGGVQRVIIGHVAGDAGCRRR